jgi:hypothetical protein
VKAGGGGAYHCRLFVGGFEKGKIFCSVFDVLVWTSTKPTTSRTPLFCRRGMEIKRPRRVLGLFGAADRITRTIVVRTI